MDFTGGVRLKRCRGLSWTRLSGSGCEVQAFRKAVEAVGKAGQLNGQRKKSVWHRATKELVHCRLSGGSTALAKASLDVARRWRCDPPFAYSEVLACNFLWAHIGGKIPALSYLAKRGFATC